MQLFEGMKAYRGDDGKIRLFRPELNMRRMLSTAERSVLPVRAYIQSYSLTTLTLRRLSMVMSYWNVLKDWYKLMPNGCRDRSQVHFTFDQH